MAIENAVYTAHATSTKQFGGAGGPGTNPDRRRLPAEVSIKADVAIGAMVGKPGAFGVSVDMAVSIPGMDRDAAEALVVKAHEVCPYSNATRGNIDVVLTVV